MPSKPAFTSDHPHDAPPITGRCYCGNTTFSAATTPQGTSYCHCDSCRRLSGAPVSAFAAFGCGDLDITPAPHHAAPVNAGVQRWFCAGCGTAIAAHYDYLPDQVYVPLGNIDQADQFPPERHSHTNASLPWVHIADDLPRANASGRAALAKAGQE